MPVFRTRALLVILCFPCFFSSVLGSRGVLKTDGIVYVRGQRGMDPRVTVIPFDAPAYVLPGGSARFVLDLELDNSFLVTFEQAGCVTKQLYFDTTVPVEKHTAEFTFPFRVILEMQDAAHAFTYAGPVGFIRYHH